MNKEFIIGCVLFAAGVFYLGSRKTTEVIHSDKATIEYLKYKNAQDMKLIQDKDSLIKRLRYEKTIDSIAIWNSTREYRDSLRAVLNPR